MSTKAERAERAFAAFERKVSKMDTPTLTTFLGECRVREEGSRQRFNKSRSVRYSESFAKRRRETSHVWCALNARKDR